jgi:hypothetical protein
MGRGQKPSAVRAKRQGINAVLVPFKNFYRFTALQLPNNYSPGIPFAEYTVCDAEAVTCGDKRSIRAYSHRERVAAFQGIEGMPQPAGLRIPDFDRSILRTGDNVFSVGGKGNKVNPVRMSQAGTVFVVSIYHGTYYSTIGPACNGGTEKYFKRFPGRFFSKTQVPMKKIWMDIDELYKISYFIFTCNFYLFRLLSILALSFLFNISQVFTLEQSVHISSFLSLKQHNLILHRVLFIHLSPV